MIIFPPNNNTPIVNEKGYMTTPFNLFVDAIAKLSISIGTGTPEGVVEALVTQLYMDDAGTAGAILYIKRDSDIGGDKTKGWILV